MGYESIALSARICRLASLFSFPPPSPTPATEPDLRQSQASLFLVHERNVRQPLLPHSLRKARLCIIFAQNTHRNSGKFNWKFEKKILSHTHRFSDRNKVHNKKNNNTTQGIKRSGKSREERKQKKVGEKRDKPSHAKNYHRVYLQS